MSGIYNYNTNRFVAVYKKMSYNLELRRNKIQSIGNSATGKSMLINLVQIYKQMDLANNTSYAKNVYVVSEYRELKYAVDNLKKCLIIIDNAELLFDSSKDSIDIARWDEKNQYIIISRVAYGLGISPNNYATLFNDNGVLKLSYLYNQKGW